jgi:23S rRNA (adenine-N6)-dimethyltransferase
VSGHRARQPPRGAPGRHFLRSQRLAADLVRAAEVAPSDLVLEIGPGTGRLTRELARVAARVEAIELDADLAERVRRELARCPHVRVVAGDALRCALPTEPFRVVANLPFAHTTSLLRRLLDDPRVPLARADVVVEWSVARKRTSVWPSTFLGVWWGVRFDLTLVRRLPARCFDPAPGVDAGVLRIVRRREPLVREAEFERFRAFLAAGFGRGAPPLRTALRSFLPPLELKRVGRDFGVDRSASARDLDVHAWAALYRAVGARR